MKQCVEKHTINEKVLCKNFVKIVALNPTIAIAKSPVLYTIRIYHLFIYCLA